MPGKSQKPKKKPAGHMMPGMPPKAHPKEMPPKGHKKAMKGHG